MDHAAAVSVITPCIADVARSKRLYGGGFGWTPVFETRQIVFYQMSGLMLGTWLCSALEAAMTTPGSSPATRPGRSRRMVV